MRIDIIIGNFTKVIQIKKVKINKNKILKFILILQLCG